MRMKAGMLGLSLIAIGLFVLSFVSIASAGQLTCCDAVLDPTSGPTPSVTFDFSVTNNVLDLSVANNTPGFAIDFIRFNGDVALDDFTAIHDPNGIVTSQWAFINDPQSPGIGFFGDFDFGLNLIAPGGPNASGAIRNGEHVHFRFTISDTPPVTQEDFTGAATDNDFVVAVHIQQVGGNQSSTGAVPKPSSVILAGFGLVALALCRKKSKAKA